MLAGIIDLNFVVFNIPSKLIENNNGLSSYKCMNMLVCGIQIDCLHSLGAHVSNFVDFRRPE